MREERKYEPDERKVHRKIDRFIDLHLKKKEGIAEIYSVDAMLNREHCVEYVASLSEAII